MKKVTLQFLTEIDLQNFSLLINADFINMNMDQTVLDCNCEERDIEPAENGFGATLIELTS